MEVVVLGSSGTFPRAGGACNGYLIRHEGTKILLDIGGGVFSRMYDWLDPGDLDALVVTHLHPDHFLDIYPYRYYLEFCAADKLPLKVFAPAGAVEHIQPLFNETDPAKFDAVFDFVDLCSGGDFVVGDIRLAAHEVSHLKPTYGIMATAAGRRLFYTSDTAFDENLVELAQGVDVLLAETTFPAALAGTPVPHMTTVEVGALARRADVGRLVLTHLWPHCERARLAAEVGSEFNGKIDLADEGLVINIGDGVE